jgi:cation transport ATPase
LQLNALYEDGELRAGVIPVRAEPFGLLLSPIFAGAAMAMSSVSVVTNARRLRRAKL